MSISDKADKYIGHPIEVDEGYETSMRRTAYAQGHQDAIDNAVKWLKENKLTDYKGPLWGMYIDDFRKALEE